MSKQIVVYTEPNEKLETGTCEPCATPRRQLIGAIDLANSLQRFLKSTTGPIHLESSTSAAPTGTTTNHKVCVLSTTTSLPKT